METEQKIQNQEEVKTQEVLKIEKRIKLTHRLNYDMYAYSVVDIYIVGMINLDGKLIKISRSNGIYVHADDDPQEVIKKIEALIRELETEVINKAKNILLIEEKIREFSTKNEITLEIE